MLVVVEVDVVIVLEVVAVIVVLVVSAVLVVTEVTETITVTDDGGKVDGLALVLVGNPPMPGGTC